MIRVFLVALLTSVSCTVLAQQWTEVFKNEVGDTYYIDFSSLKREGQKRIFWRATDYKEPIGTRVYSTRNKVLLDCRQATLVLLHETYFTQRGLKGAPASPEPTGQLVRIAPQTVNAELMRLVCSK
jgi:hypothetical protein